MGEEESKLPSGLRPAIGAAVIVAALIIGAGSWQQAEYYWDAQDQASENARHANYDVRYRCAPKAPLDKRNCTIETRREQRGYERYEQDLYAQKTAAFWTALMGSAAVIGMMLSTIGVWLVYSTFSETRRTANAAAESANHAADAADEMRKANELARQTMEFEHRPIMEFVDFVLEEFGETRDTILLRAKWRNIGKQPALPVRTKMHKEFTSGNPTDAQVEAALAARPAQDTPWALKIVPVGEEHLSEPVAIDAERIGRKERPANFVARGIDRFASAKCVLIIAYLEYRTAIGESRTWETEQIMGIFPRYDDAGVLRVDGYHIGPPVRLRMT